MSRCRGFETHHATHGKAAAVKSTVFLGYRSADGVESAAYAQADDGGDRVGGNVWENIDYAKFPVGDDRQVVDVRDAATAHVQGARSEAAVCFLSDGASCSG